MTDIDQLSNSIKSRLPASGRSTDQATRRAIRYETALLGKLVAERAVARLSEHLDRARARVSAADAALATAAAQIDDEVRAKLSPVAAGRLGVRETTRD